MKNAAKPNPRFPATYADLVRWHRPRTLRTQAECDEASNIVEQMIGHNLSLDQEDYMDLLATLVIQYDDEHHPFKGKEMSQLEAIAYLVEESKMTASDLGRLLGNRELGSKILRGERTLSLANITKLSERFCVSPEFFMPSSPKAKARRKQNKPVVKWRSSSTSTSRDSES